MDDLLWTITKLFGGVVGYGDVLWIATSSVCLLLLAAAPRLVAADSGPGLQARRTPLILLGLVMGVALASGLPDWLGIPQVNDYATPWHVLLAFWLLSSAPVAFGFFRALHTGGRHLLLAGCCVVAGLLLGWVLIGATLRMGAYGVIAPAALLYAAPLPVGGVLLGWALACGHRQYALYIAAWFMAVATVGLSSYLLPMSTSMYQVAQLAGVPRFSLEYAGAVTIVRAAIQTQVLISGIYCLVTLALLVLPLPLSAAALRGRLWRVAAARRTTSEQTYEANRQVTPLDDRRLLPARPSHWSSPTVRSQEAPGATPTALHTHSDCQMRQVPAPSTSAGWTPPLWVAKHRRACWSRRRHILRRSGRLPHSS